MPLKIPSSLYLLVLRSHTLMLQSAAELVNNLRTSGLGWNRTRCTTPLEPRRLCVQYCFSTSHTFTVLSLEPAQKRMQSSQTKATRITNAPSPSHLPPLVSSYIPPLPCISLQSRISLSFPPRIPFPFP